MQSSSRESGDVERRRGHGGKGPSGPSKTGMRGVSREGLRDKGCSPVKGPVRAKSRADGERGETSGLERSSLPGRRPRPTRGFGGNRNRGHFGTHLPLRAQSWPPRADSQDPASPGWDSPRGRPVPRAAVYGGGRIRSSMLQA